MLENVLETQGQQIYKLEREIEIEEETTTLNFVCKMCDESQDCQDNFKSHNHLMHEDESLPTTSKGGKCDFNSDDETDLVIHKQTVHNVKKPEYTCTYVDYTTNKGDELDIHLKTIHTSFKCIKCDRKFEADEKFHTHFCKVHVQNPEYGSLYVKGWYDANDCKPVYFGRKIVKLHG